MTHESRNTSSEPSCSGTVLPPEGDLGAQTSMMSLTLDAIPFLLGSEIQGWVPEMDFFDS